MMRFAAYLSVFCIPALGQSASELFPTGPSTKIEAPLRWSFEDGMEGWKSQNCVIETAAGNSTHGGRSLMVNAVFPKAASMEFTGDLKCEYLGHITFSILIPEGSPADVQVMLYLKDKDGLFFQHLHPKPLTVGRHQISVDVSGDSVDLAPQGHIGQWDRRTASQMETIGIKLISRATYSGGFYIDSIDRVRQQSTMQPLRIVDFQPGHSKVEVFDKFEVTFRLNRDFRNPFDPAKIRVDAEFVTPRVPRTIPGFFHQEYIRTKSPRRERFLVDDQVTGTGRSVNSELVVERWEEMIPVGAPAWKVRFTPMEPGEHKYRITVKAGTEVIQSGVHSFLAVPSERRGFVRICKSDPSYFEFDNGEFFYPIGHNVRSPFDERWWATVLEQEKLPPDRGTFAYDEILAKMHKNGENLAEIWMASWFLAIEWTAEWRGYRGLTDYNLANAAKLDYMLQLAEKNDMYYHLVLDNHGKASTWCDPEWINNPYNSDNNGPAVDVEDYFYSPEAREIYKKTIRYLIARWGYSPRIMGVEFWSELDLTGEGFDFKGRPIKADWHKEIAQEFQRLDPFRHLVTTHYSTDFRRLDPKVASLPEIDYVVVDAYRPRGSIVPLIDRTYEASSQYGKPCFVTEYGGSPWATTAAQVIPLLKADLQGGLWATYMTPSAASPLLWWFEFIDHQDQYFRYKALANYAKGEDRRGKGLYQAPGVVVSQAPFDRLRLDAKVLKNGNSAYAWVYDKTAMESWPQEGLERTFQNASLSISQLEFGDYRYEVWDTKKGEIIKKGETSITTGNSLSIPLPDFTIDCAVKIKPN